MLASGSVAAPVSSSLSVMSRTIWIVLGVCLLMSGAPTAYCQSALTAGAQTAPSASAQTTSANETHFREEVVGEAADGGKVKAFGTDNAHVFWFEEKDGSQKVFLDGQAQGGAYKDVQFGRLSPDGAHAAFFGKRDSQWYLVLDGQERPQGYTKVSNVAFQPKGTSVAFGGCHEKKCRLVVDGAETGEEFEEISFPKYSGDGKRLAYLGKRAKMWVAIVDGKQMGPDVRDIWGPVWGFSPDSSRFYFAALANGWNYIVDGETTPGFAVVSPIAFSPDGEHYAYAGTDAQEGMKKQKTIGTVVLDGRAKGTYEGRGMNGILVQALSNTREFLAPGVREFTPDLHGVSTPDFDGEGNLVFAARRDKGDIAVFVAGGAGPGFDEILSPVIFSSDSLHLAYVARRDQSFVEVRDDKPGKTFDAGKRGATQVKWIMASSDATHIAYETVSGGAEFRKGTTARAHRTVVLDGQVGPEYNALDIDAFGFDAGATHYFYEVLGADGDRSLVNVDGHESRQYDAVGSAHFASRGSVVFFARDGLKFLRVTYTP
jgi:hypothetical protein